MLKPAITFFAGFGLVLIGSMQHDATVKAQMVFAGGAVMVASAVAGLAYLLSLAANQEASMAASPKYKVYSNKNEYVASCKYAEDAAAIVSMRGDGTTIRLGHSVVLWTEGQENLPAGESYDNVAEVCDAREDAHLAKYRSHWK